MELHDYLRILRAHWRGVLALSLAGVALAAVASLLTPKTYAADASGFVSSGTSASAAEASVGDTLAKSRAVSYVDLAKSRATAQDVIDRLKLDARPDTLINRISVTQPLNTVVIKITAKASTPVQAKDLANAWVAALARQVKAVENPSGKATSALSLVPVESAVLPTSPVSPNVPRNVALGLLLGGLLGVGYALLRSQFDRRIRTAEEISEQHGVTVAGAVPTSPALARDRGDLIPILVGDVRAAQDPTHAGEAFLKLRTNLQYMDVDNPPRVIVVTSPMPGDGKSTVSANLAVAMSQAGEQVVLVDGDLRRPVVADSFGLSEGAGLTDVLVGRADFADVVQHSDRYPNLSILAAGRVPPNPSELLGSQSMRRLLKELAERGTVIVDAPPLLPVTDGAVLAANSDGALIVVSAGRTLDAQLGASLGHLDRVKAHALGIVVNRMDPRGAGSSYYGGYGYGYGYTSDATAEVHDEPVSGDERGEQPAGLLATQTATPLAAPGSEPGGAHSSDQPAATGSEQLDGTGSDGSRVLLETRRSRMGRR